MNDLPHSRQHDLERDVTSPQNGHILSDLRSRFARLNPANKVLNQPMKKASLPRKRFRNRRRLRAIDLLEFSPGGDSLSDLAAPTSSEGFSRRLPRVYDDTPRDAILCQIAHIGGPKLGLKKNGCEQFGPAIFWLLGHAERVTIIIFYLR